MTPRELRTMKKVNFEWAPAGEWTATFDGEYDGAPDGGGLMGFGLTKVEALADLLDKANEQEDGK